MVFIIKLVLSNLSIKYQGKMLIIHIKMSNFIISNKNDYFSNEKKLVKNIDFFVFLQYDSLYFKFFNDRKLIS